jgi:hypothetical protein
MDSPAEDLSETTPSGTLRRPRDLALLLLAIGTGPSRVRARDQQADVAGGELRRRVLDHVAALDPEPGDLDAALAAVVNALDAPTGPSRAAAVHFRQEWNDAQLVPGYWSWLIAEALERSERREARRGDP